MTQALGADRETVMQVLNSMIGEAQMSFTAQEFQVMWEMLADPDSKLQVITVLAVAAQNSGMFK